MKGRSPTDDLRSKTISQIRIYAKDDCQVIPLESGLYNRFTAQLSNCAGHRLEVNTISSGRMINDSDCFIEVRFMRRRQFSFPMRWGWVIPAAYNASRNMMYWGKSGYSFCVDYTKFNADPKEHKADILAQHQVPEEMIAQHFESFK